jgi:hypothetical protein
MTGIWTVIDVVVVVTRTGAVDGVSGTTSPYEFPVFAIDIEEPISLYAVTVKMMVSPCW